MNYKKNILIITIILIIIVLTTSIYLYLNQKEYTYICLNKPLIKEQTVLEEYLKECTTKSKLKDGVIVNKNELLDERDGYNYQLKKEKYEVGEILYKYDFELVIPEKVITTDIALLNEVEVLDHGNSSEDFTKYKAYIKNNKLYAINLGNNQEKIMFDEEPVKNIAIRPYCCAGNAKLIILTTSGSVYISKQDCTYSFNFNTEFEKLPITDIVSFKLIPKEDFDIVKSLYGINSDGEEILIIEPEW